MHLACGRYHETFSGWRLSSLFLNSTAMNQGSINMPLPISISADLMKGRQSDRKHVHFLSPPATVLFVEATENLFSRQTDELHEIVVNKSFVSSTTHFSLLPCPSNDRINTEQD